MMRSSFRNRRALRFTQHSLSLALVLGLLCLALPAAAQQRQAPQQQQQQQPGQAEPPRAGALQVGTYNPETVFNAYPGREQFMQRMQQLQTEAVQAQQEGDEQRLNELQQQATQAQQEVLSQFEADIRAAMPEVAQEAGVQLVVVEVTYSNPPVQTRDVTQLIVQRLAPDAAEQDGEQPQPQQQQQQQQPPQPPAPGE